MAKRKMMSLRSSKTGRFVKVRGSGKAPQTTVVGRSAKTGRFLTVDGNYVKQQAAEAFETFFAPVSGALRALKDAGEEVAVANDRERH